MNFRQTRVNLNIIIILLTLVLIGLLVYKVLYNSNTSETIATSSINENTYAFVKNRCSNEIFKEKNPYKLFKIGEKYFGWGNVYNLQCARMAYAKSLRATTTNNLLIWYQYGRIDFLEGDFDNALYKFNKQIALFGDEVPNVYYMIGLTYAYKAKQTKQVNDWESAEAGFKNYLKFVPDSPWAHTDLAWVYFMQGKFADMLPILEDGLKSNPNHPWLLNMYGLAIMNTSDNKRDALLYFKKAQVEAGKLDTADWGRAYPGNNPKDWSQGLYEFQSTIDKNIALLEKN